MNRQPTERAEYVTFGEPGVGVHLAARPAPVRTVPRRDARGDQPSRRIRTVGVVAALDFVAVAVGVGLAAVLAVGATGSSPSRAQLWVFALPAAWVLVLAGNGGLRERDIGIPGLELGRLLRTFVQIGIAVAVGCYVTGARSPRGLFLTALALALGCDVAVRAAGRFWERRGGHHGHRRQAVLAVGQAGAIASFAEAVRRDGAERLDLRGSYLLDDDPAASGTTDPYDVEAIQAAARDAGATAVAVVSSTHLGGERLRSLAWQLEGSGIELFVASGLMEITHRRLRIDPVGWMPLLRVREPEFRGLRRVAKSLMDRAVALLVLVLLLPLLGVLALLVRLSSPGPALYRQTRIGRNGEPFAILKFRSMYRDADSRLEELREDNVYRAGPLFKLHDDPRVTRVGRVLRRYSLDELPQLFNVLVGNMSLVGPRPPLPAEVAEYTPDVRRRLLVKPGITGLWQVSGRNDLSWRDGVRLDLRYVENWSPTLDLLILWKTLAAVARGTGAY